MNDLRLGVIVPCRNEAAVIARRIGNLARESWPAGEHRVLVVDDGSTDGTARAVQRVLDDDFDARVRVECIPNRLQPGKAGAIATALEDLGDAVDLIVLTDADVVQTPGSLAALTDAFRAEPELGMACAAQCFVRELADTGEAPAAPAPGPAAAPWDRWTAAVRRLESRRGRLFSVHGQLLVWRADLGLRPQAAVAADDLDLILAMRRQHPGRTARLVTQAVFHEQKPTGAEDAAGQALRRARAYVQALRANEVERNLQGLSYRYLPLLAPRLVVLFTLLALLFVGRSFGLAGVAIGLALLAACALVPSVRRLVELLRVIDRARRAEHRESLATQWEMPR